MVKKSCKQKGGGWFNFSEWKKPSWFASSSPTTTTPYSYTPPPIASPIASPVVPVAPIPLLNEQNPAFNGGKRHTKTKRGGKHNLGLLYYASPVSGLRVAEPTYMITGGSKTRRKTRRSRNHKTRHVKR